MPLSLGIGLHGIVLVSSDTYELRHVIRQQDIEDMHVELTASGNLDLCFRVGVRGSGLVISVCCGVWVRIRTSE